MMDDLKAKVIQNLKILGKTKELMGGVNTMYDDSRMVSKSLSESEKAKQAGNALFLSSYHDFKIHHRILCSYNESIAYAPTESEELATAFGNKSALLLHVRKYAESIIEADKALRITKSIALKVKLLIRKAESHTALGSSENVSCMEKARFLMSKFDGTVEVEEKLNHMIDKSQKILDEAKLDTPKENRRKTQGMRLISEVEKLDVWKSIAIGYSERHGKHLIAARDFEPGEIVFVETPYLDIVPDPKAFVYCYHCLKYLWTVVPCDQCAWRTFCSTECRDQALDEYHNMECSAILQMKETFAFGQYTHVPVIISLFFKALKEAGGSIHHLQMELEALDKSTDRSIKALSSDERIANYRNIFSLPTRNLEKFDFDICLKNAAVALSGLARFTKLFGSTYKYTETNKLIANDTAVFVGALLAKYAIIITSRCSQKALFDPDEKPDDVELGHGIFIRRQNIDSTPLNSVSVLGQYTILNCIPNVMKAHTHDNKSIAFALHPIKKGEQLTSTVATMYLGVPKSVRQAKYRKLYNHPCDCRACSENWFEAPGSNGAQGIPVSTSDLAVAKEVVDETHSIFYEFNDNKKKQNHPDLKLLTRTARLVQKAWQHFSLPSPLCVYALSLLMKVSTGFYQTVEEHLEFFETCKK